MDSNIIREIFDKMGFLIKTSYHSLDAFSGNLISKEEMRDDLKKIWVGLKICQGRVATQLEIGDRPYIDGDDTDSFECDITESIDELMYKQLKINWP